MSVFQFKQFHVRQSSSAMKVGTDGVLLGAWVDKKLPSNILDIGSGTGVISLMLAQRFPRVRITGVEIDFSAWQESVVNVQHSHWADFINIQNCSLQEFVSANLLPFDLIVSNPPFYQTSQKSGNKSRDLARHTDSLPFSVLVASVVHLLSNDGVFSCILPYEYLGEFSALCQDTGLFLNQLCNVRPTPTKPFKRALCSFSRFSSDTDITELVIEDKGRHGYSDEYIRLTKPFYLNM